MLDLDSLAEKRAKALNQTEDGWRKVIWSAGFQKLSQSMSDGEVESLISFCPTVRHLECVVDYLERRSSETGDGPFTLLLNEAKDAGLSPEAWIDNKIRGLGR